MGREDVLSAFMVLERSNRLSCQDLKNLESCKVQIGDFYLLGTTHKTHNSCSLGDGDPLAGLSQHVENSWLEPVQPRTWKFSCF